MSSQRLCAARDASVRAASLIVVGAASGLALVCAIGCGRTGGAKSSGDQAPPPTQPPAAAPTAPAAPRGAIPPPPPGTGVGVTALTWSAADDWQAVAPANAMRKAQYVVPGEGGDAECVIYYFGPRQGGPPEANAKRWASQFTADDGSPAESSIWSLRVGDIDVLLIEAAGTYSGGFMGDGRPLPSHRIIGAIATGPDANWFFKLTGPDATVQAQRDAFLALVQSLQRGSAAQ